MLTFTVTPAFVLILFGCVILVALFLAYFIKPGTFEDSRVKVFLAALTALSIVIILAFYYSLIVVQQQQQQLAIIQETSRISDSVITQLLNDINVAASKIPNFVFSISPLISCNTQPPPDPETAQNCIEKDLLSYKIFVTWQDTILSNSFIDLSPLAVNVNFLQEAHSTQLFEQWPNNKINFNSKTQSYGDLLFEYGLKVEPQTPEAYVNAANKLINDPRYKDIT